MRHQTEHFDSASLLLPSTQELVAEGVALDINNRSIVSVHLVSVLQPPPFGFQGAAAGAGGLGATTPGSPGAGPEHSGLEGPASPSGTCHSGGIQQVRCEDWYMF